MKSVKLNKVITILLVLLCVISELKSEPSKIFKKRSIVSISKHFLKRILWQKKVITYALHGRFDSRHHVKLEDARLILCQAFSEWQNSSCFKFQDKTPSIRSDIKVIFTNDNRPSTVHYKNYQNEIPDSLEHFEKCERRFRNSPAHAFFRHHKRHPAEIHINNDILWMESKSVPGSVSLSTILVHEIGHVLGLAHSNDPKSVMYEFIYTNEIKNVSNQDRANIMNLYRSLCKN
jgi:hypothetical protein